MLVSVIDFGGVGDGVTDDTAAIQGALAASNNVYFPGSREGRKYKFTNLVVGLRSRLWGDGPRASVLRQISTATGAAVTLEAGLPPVGHGVNDITEGAYRFHDLGLEVASSVGIKMGPAGLASMLLTDNLRIVHQHAETLGSPPYTVVSGTRGIDADGGAAPGDTAGNKGAIFMAHHRNLEIRSFETAIRARTQVNEWHVHGWLIDCKYGFDLNWTSTWRCETTVESHVSNARMFVLDGPVGNLIVEGGRCELPVAGSYMFEFGSAIAAENIRVRNVNVLIAGDGQAWPGRKYIGTLPQDVVFEFNRVLHPLVAAATGTTMQYAMPVRVGGLSFGNGKITVGRNAGGADCQILHDGSHFYLMGGNSTRICGDGTSNFKVDVNNTGVGFQGNLAISKPQVTGSRGGNAALASLLTALHSYGLIADATS